MVLKGTGTMATAETSGEILRREIVRTRAMAADLRGEADELERAAAWWEGATARDQMTAVSP